MKPLDLATISLSGLNLIEASAGTGKTWTIAALYILLLLEKELRPEQILVVTYTKAATAELKERIRGRISSTLELLSSQRSTSEEYLEQVLLSSRLQERDKAKKLLTRALYSFDDAAIFTIHGFCQRALLENTFESGSLFGSDLINDQSTLISQVCNDFWRTHILSQPADFIEQLIAKQYTPETLAAPLIGIFQNPELRIIPHTTATPLAPLKSELRQLFSQLSTLWDSDHSSIVSQLSDARLNQKSYSPAQISVALSALQQWLSSANPAHDFKKLDFFSADKISKKITKQSPFTPNHHFFLLCQQIAAVKEAIQCAFQDTIISCQISLKEWLADKLQQRKSIANCRSYDDLLLDLHSALAASSGQQLAETLRLRYQAAMIDEFQDTDPVQWQIFQRLGDATGYPLFLIGDPKQAIYSFRGADIFAYLAAGAHVAPENGHTLTTNFRSCAPLVHAVSTLFSTRPHPFLRNDIAFQPVISGRAAQDNLLLKSVASPEAPLSIWLYPREDQSKVTAKPVAVRTIVQSVADEIVRLLQPGNGLLTTRGSQKNLTASDIAVLVKSHRQAAAVQEALRAVGVPSVQQGGSTIFASQEALDLLRILRATAEPHRGTLVREALLTGIMGVSAASIAEYVTSQGEHPAWDSWLEKFQQLNMAAVDGGIVAFIEQLLDSCGVRAALLARIGGERSITNILHCAEIAHHAEREQGKNLAGLITWLERAIESHHTEDAALLRLETDDNAVIISTIHASKGLQYPIVFIPFAWDTAASKSDRTLFHDDTNTLTLDLADQDDHVTQTRSEQDGEAMRLLYVALTRAEFRCYLVWGALNSAADSPLYTLLHGAWGTFDAAAFPTQPDLTLLTDLQQHLHGTETTIATTFMPLRTADGETMASPPVCSATSYAHLSLSALIQDDWRVASFSSITSKICYSFEAHDHDASGNLSESQSLRNEARAFGTTIFDFPRGAKAGTCLHDIFELLDFSVLNSEAITTATVAALSKNGFSDKWLAPVAAMVADVTAAPLISSEPEFSLATLAAGSWQSELEFYLPIKQLSLETLQEIFAGLYDRNQFHEFYQVLSHLSFRHSVGMLQGFIDMVFTHNNRYYIIDWKSNHLGMTPEEYARPLLHDSMSHSAYILQYHLYTVALDRLLAMKISDYCYEKHFGGVIYIYLRGISRGVPDTGIYFDRPSPAFIRNAAERMLA